MSWLLLLACRSEPTPLPPAAPVWVESRKVDEGKPARIHAPAGTAMPVVEGLTLTQESVGEDGNAVWDAVGAKGSYVIDVPGPDQKPVPIYVDIGVDGPTGGQMADLAAPAPRPPPIWPYVLGGLVGLGTLAAAGIAAWKKWRPLPPPVPPEPPDVLALRAWVALRARTDLEPAQLALELSSVYRRYLDATRVWPATSRTTREILDNLSGELSAVELDCARRLLTAMDLVKFADREALGLRSRLPGEISEGTGTAGAARASLFEQLDADFRRLVSPVRGRSDRV